jgi:hypothetical protein
MKMNKLTGSLLGSALLLVVSIAHGATLQPFLPAGKSPSQVERVEPSQPQKLQPSSPVGSQPVQIDRVERIRVTRGLTLDRLLTKPDATVVISADGKQSATVGDLRRRFDARQRGITNIQAGKPLTGGFGKVRFPRGVKSASILQQSVIQETTLAESLRSKQVARKAFSSVQQGVVSKELITSQPGISSVNNKIRGYIVSPRSYLTIKGRDFGGTIGRVNVIGSYFPSGGTALRVANWRTDEIYVLVPPEIRGVVDHPVSIQVITSAGQTFRFDDGKFVAAREEIVVRTNIPQMISFESPRGWVSAMSNEGFVNRYKSGESVDCPAPGQDRLRGPDRYAYSRSIFAGRGFVLVGLNASWGRTDSGNGDGWGNAGSRTFFPGYGFSDWYGQDQEIIDVSWGVWRSHMSPEIFLSGYDICSSSYQIEVVLSGPAGVAPF